MKNILTILSALVWSLLPCLSAPPHLAVVAKKRAVAGVTLFLDETGLTSAAGAWSVNRKLRSAYGGNAINIRRSSDNTNQDIGFAANILDEATLETFCSGTDCYVEIIYDQSGGALADMEQTGDDTKQPQIAAAGVMNKDANGNAYMTLDGSNDVLSIGNSFNAPWTFYCVAYIGSGSANNDRVYGATSTSSSLRYRNALNELAHDNNAVSLDIGNLTLDTKYLLRHGADLTNLTFIVNNGSESAVANTDATSRTSFFLGAASSTATEAIAGRIYEFIFYTSDATASDATAQSNINAFYSIW